MNSEVKRILLIGYMGAGKTTVGKELARQLGVTFYDLDWYIETRMRMRVPEIFAQKGEEGFRDRILDEGVTDPNEKVVYLRATPEVLFRHLKMGKGVRPLLQGKSDEELIAFIKEQLAYREQFYLKARHVVDIPCMETEDKITETVNLVLKAVKCNTLN